jgi:hypothetical protein
LVENMDEIDRLLAGLNDAGSSALPGKAGELVLGGDGAIDDLLNNLDESTKRGVRDRLSHAAPAPPNVSLNGLLAHVKVEQEETARVFWQQQQDLAAAAEIQAQQRAEKLEQLRLQRRAELAVTARSWLAKLSKKSEEGRWFEEFACNYESQLAAAIDYLEALQEVNGI